MKYLSITKLILGIFSMTIACIFIFYQLSLGNPLFDFMKHSGGTTPLLISGCFLLAGILSILTRKEDRLESSNLIYAGSFTCSMFILLPQFSDINIPEIIIALISLRFFPFCLA